MQVRQQKDIDIDHKVQLSVVLLDYSGCPPESTLHLYPLCHTLRG